jgi:hypothetical protein
MILHCTFEELSAINAGAERVLESAGEGGVVAPPEIVPDIESLLPRFVGDLTIETLTDVATIIRVIEYIMDEARQRTDQFIIDQHPAAEDAINSYFEYAHMLTFLDRARRADSEMRALIDLMTGEPASEAVSYRFTFED